MAIVKYWQAVREALREEMVRDESVIVFGEDVGAAGGPYGATIGLQDQFGARIKDSPISEQVMMGAATGAALTGLRPVVEIMYVDFLTLASDQLVNTAAKMHWMSGGQLTVPLVVRTLYGGGIGNGPQHAQSLEGWLTQVPGIKVVWAATPDDAKGLLKAAIRDNNPVVTIDSLSSWSLKGEVTEGDLIVPLGVARIRKTGTDVTLVAWGDCVLRTVKAAELLQEQGISAEVIDLRTLSPLDYPAILESVARTKRLVISQNAAGFTGLSSDISARVSEDLFGELLAPIVRVTSPFAPTPFNKDLERSYLPSVEDIVSAAERVCSFK